MGRSLISSMLLRPIIFTPFRSIAPYREDVFWMGSPIVFQTAPPQPASKARMTWPPVFVGGPEASQKGFGERRPQKLTDRSDMDYLPTAFLGDGTSLMPRQISQITTASMPSQPIARTTLAIWVSCSRTPRLPNR